MVHKRWHEATTNYEIYEALCPCSLCGVDVPLETTDPHNHATNLCLPRKPARKAPESQHNNTVIVVCVLCRDAVGKFFTQSQLINNYSTLTKLQTVLREAGWLE